MDGMELSWNTAISIAQLFIEERFHKLISGDKEALIGCYKPESVISWKGHLVPYDKIIQCYNSLRNKSIELVSIDAQPIPDAPGADGTWANQVMVVVSIVVSPETPEDTLMSPAMATHTFVLSPDLMDTTAPVFYISHHIYR